MIQNKIHSINNVNYEFLAKNLYSDQILTLTKHLSYIKKEFTQIAYIGPIPNYFIENLPISKYHVRKKK